MADRKRKKDKNGTSLKETLEKDSVLIENDQSIKEQGTSNSKKLTLPPSGLAEDILGKIPQTAPSGRTEAAELPKDRRRNPRDARLETSHDGAVSLVERRVNRALPPRDIDITEKYVIFSLEKEEYGLSIFQVQEINRIDKITKVPNSPDHVIGVINLRGKIIPVIDLKKRLKIGQSQVNPESRVVIIENGPKILGLLVDKVSQVLNLLPNQIEEAPDEVIQLNDNYVKGVGKLDDRMIMLLDLAQLVDQETVEQAY